VKGTVIGIGLWGVAGCGIAFGWLGPWGHALWVPLLVLGLIFVCFVGHFLLFQLPLLAIQDVVEWWRNREKSS
jgi:fatty acid desaturase